MSAATLVDVDDVDAIVAELVQFGLVIIGHDAEAAEQWTLTPAGQQVASRTAIEQRG